MATTGTSTATIDGAPPALVKGQVVEELGVPALLLPSLLRRGLEANDRAKYLLSLLQAARAHADDPSQPWLSLREERVTAGLADPGLDSVVERSRREGPDVYLVPGVAHIQQLLVEAVREMLAPFDTADFQLEDWWLDTGRLDLLLGRHRLERALQPLLAVMGRDHNGQWYDRPAVLPEVRPAVWPAVWGALGVSARSQRPLATRPRARAPPGAA